MSLVKGTFYFYFYYTNNNPNYLHFNLNPADIRFRDSLPTCEELNSAISKYGKYNKVIPIKNYEGKDTGFAWLVSLTSRSGQEEIVKLEATKIAHQVARDVGGLIVQGPHCNNQWH